MTYMQKRLSVFVHVAGIDDASGKNTGDLSHRAIVDGAPDGFSPLDHFWYTNRPGPADAAEVVAGERYAERPAHQPPREMVREPGRHRAALLARRVVAGGPGQKRVAGVGVKEIADDAAEP